MTNELEALLSATTWRLSGSHSIPRVLLSQGTSTTFPDGYSRYHAAPPGLAKISLLMSKENAMRVYDAPAGFATFATFFGAEPGGELTHSSSSEPSSSAFSLYVSIARILPSGLIA